jgi:RhtB (resistance to homoserine/threonine) family protein
MNIHLWAFVGVAVLVIATPGPDTMVVTKNAVVHGRRAALGSAFGVAAGLLIWTACAALGIAALVRESAAAFTVLKLAGAGYLVWLGVQALRSAGHQQMTVGGAIPVVRAGAQLGFRQGLLSNLGNPKIAVFFTGLLPQFVAPGEPVLGPFLVLGSVFVSITVVWLCGYAVFAVRIADRLTRPSVKAVLDRVTGVVLVGLGIRLALEQRT